MLALPTTMVALFVNTSLLALTNLSLTRVPPVLLRSKRVKVRITGLKFAQRAIGKVRQIEDLKPYLVANKATTVVVR